jgi:hypothetical protein
MIAISGKADLKANVIAALQKARVEAKPRKIDNALSSGFRKATFKDKESTFSVDIIFSFLR